MAILSTPLQYLTSTPPVTRGFAAATIAATSLYLWISWSTGSVDTPWLTLVPGSSLFYPWTFATSALVEVTIIEVCCSPPPRFSYALMLHSCSLRWLSYQPRYVTLNGYGAQWRRSSLSSSASRCLMLSHLLLIGPSSSPPEMRTCSCKKL